MTTAKTARWLDLIAYLPRQRRSARWLIQPHQLVSWRGRTYIVAWCEGVSDWRHFRLDRIIDALAAEGRFDRRPEFQPVTQPQSLFRPGDGEAEAVRVRFSPAISRWARERYRDCEEQADGSVIGGVTFRAPENGKVAGQDACDLEHGETSHAVRSQWAIQYTLGRRR